MKRTACSLGTPWHSLVALAAVLALGLSACGDDSDVDARHRTDDRPRPSPRSTRPRHHRPLTPPARHRHRAASSIRPAPTTSSLRIGYEGGFVPVEYAFLNLPTLLVTGDGRVIVQGPDPRSIRVRCCRTCNSARSAKPASRHLLRLAEEHGLFRDVEYTDPTNIADAPYTVVDDLRQRRHLRAQAYALGLGGDGTESDEARAQLASFVEQATDVVSAAGADTLGPQAAVRGDDVPDPGDGRRRVRHSRRHRADGGRLAGRRAGPARRRLRVRRPCRPSRSRDLFAAANQLTCFVEDGITYQLVVKPQLPGVPAC